ncbi:MAG: hypothetical protein GY748_17785 [Planctomycetaceae bacterium]|nr:hypothetical protein [Planctomycetaceae bacterium]
MNAYAALYDIQMVQKPWFLQQRDYLEFQLTRTHVFKSANLGAHWKGLSPWKRFSRPHLAGRKLNLPQMMQTGSNLANV